MLISTIKNHYYKQVRKSLLRNTGLGIILESYKQAQQFSQSNIKESIRTKRYINLLPKRERLIIRAGLENKWEMAAAGEYHYDYYKDSSSRFHTRSHIAAFVPAVILPAF